MIANTISAVFDGNVFEPEQSVDLPAGTRVELTLVDLPHQGQRLARQTRIREMKQRRQELQALHGIKTSSVELIREDRNR